MPVGFDARELQAELKQLERVANDPAKAMRRVANILVTAVEDEFETEGRGRWEPSQRAIRESGKTLQDTGNAAASIRPESTRTEAAAYSDVPYLRFHALEEHGGIRIPGENLVRDPFDVDREDVLAEVEDVIAEELAR